MIWKKSNQSTLIEEYNYPEDMFEARLYSQDDQDFPNLYWCGEDCWNEMKDENS